MPYDPDYYERCKREHRCKSCPEPADFTFDDNGRMRWKTLCVHCAKRNREWTRRRAVEDRENLKLLRVALLKNPMDVQEVISVARAVVRL